MTTTRAMVGALLMAWPVSAQVTADPFPRPIPAADGVVTVGYADFAVLPDIDGVAARMMLLVDEPGTRRFFVNDMRGPIYSVSYDGRTVTPYIDSNAPQWAVRVQSQGRERGMQSFAFHPQFGQAGTPGAGRFYTWTDVVDTAPRPDFSSGSEKSTHATVLLEWTARDPAAAVYDGGPPRELLRLLQPFANHNGGLLAFNPLASPGQPDFGLLYIGAADGGSGGDPLNMAQNLGSAFGKILRIDPLGSNSANGKYGIPAANPFAADGNPATLGEIYAYGVRNPQRFGWDRQTGRLLVADIGQNTIEELSPVTAGANLGWNRWEGSFRFVAGQGVDPANQRGEAGLTYPVVEYAQPDPLLQPQSAITGVVVYRGTAIPELANLVVFGDLPSGEIFYIRADALPHGGQDPIRRILLRDGGTSRTLLEVIRARNVQQGRMPATRADLRFAEGPDGQVFLLNKADGTIRRLVSATTPR
jgi:glucose/arabinose dehydrogenase